MDSLTEKWRDGGTTLGAWLSLSDPHLAEVAATAGYDYVCIDMQHGRSDISAVRYLLHAMARAPAIPIVRVPWNEPGIIGQALDAGALGIIVPMVNTPADAQRAADACRYPPAGIRSYGPLMVAARYGPSYPAEANAAVACIVMIETREAVERIDEILAVGGIDAVYVGPSDLSMTYGLTPRVDQSGDVFDAALKAVVVSCELHGVVPGIHANADVASARHAAGFRMVTVGLDAVSAARALRTDIAEVRAALS
jgi:4-hydroxy-2-oxoheptanedioate aldolase